MYSLIVDERERPGSKPGNLGAVSLQTGPMTEDALIRVRATKTFAASANRLDESDLLDARLYLKVLANPELAVSTDPQPILDYRQGAAIKIAATQKSVQYRAYLRRIADADFVHGDAGGADIATVPGWPGVQVQQPPPTAPKAWRTWQTPAGYVALSDPPVPGTGGELRLAIPSFLDRRLAGHRPGAEAASGPCRPSGFGDHHFRGPVEPGRGAARAPRPGAGAHVAGAGDRHTDRR